MIGKQWCVRDTLTGAVYPQPNKTIAEKVADMHGHSEVFEQAHTPSDDEREALIDAEGWPVATVVDVVMKRWSNDNDTIRRGDGGWSWKGLAETAIQSLAQAGLLRRTVQGEPTDAEIEKLAWALMEVDGYKLSRVAAARSGTLDVYLAKAQVAHSLSIALRAAAAVREEGQGHDRNN